MWHTTCQRTESDTSHHAQRVRHNLNAIHSKLPQNRHQLGFRVLAQPSHQQPQRTNASVIEFLGITWATQSRASTGPILLVM